jgi:hypothetical protein
MDGKHDVDPNDMTPNPEAAPPPDEMEQAQKDAAEKRLEGGGYGG